MSQKYNPSLSERVVKSLPFRMLEGCVYGFVCQLALLSGGAYMGLQSPEITSEKQIESIVTREREKLSIDDRVKINVRKGELSHSKKVGEQAYEIELSSYQGKYPELVLVHELAHVGHGDCDAVTPYPSLFRTKNCTL